MPTSPVSSARVLVAVVLTPGLALVAACGGDDPPSTTTTTAEDASTTTALADESTTTTSEARTVIEIMVVDGKPQGGEREIDLRVGELVTLRVEADGPDEVHVHGYDLSDDVAPGSPAEIAFTADIPGQFEVELEGSGVVLLELVVA